MPKSPSKRKREAKSFSSLKSKIKVWISSMKKRGHTPIKIDDSLNFFVLSDGHHNGPGCSKCSAEWCWHCTDSENISDCQFKIKKPKSISTQKIRRVKDA